MSSISVRVMAIAAAAVIAFACPQDAAARGPGGGSGFHGGGGGFHGGGFHSFGGGGFHAVGGGVRSFSPALSHPAFSAGAVHSFNAGSLRTFSRPTFHAGVAHPFTSAHGLTYRGMPYRGSRSMAGLRAGERHYGSYRTTHGMRTTSAATRGMRTTGAVNAQSVRRHAGITTGSATAGAAWAGHAHGGRWRDHADWRRHRGFFGWGGPVFWPWFYDDVYADIFWDYGPYYYEDPFWAYGYGDIYGALFSPYSYDELADWTAPAPVIRGGAARRSAAGGQTLPSQPTQWSAMCGDDAREVANLPIDRISAAVSPDEVQRAALDALANASVQAAQTIKTACPTDVAFAPTGRLDAMERRVQAMVQAVALIRPPLESFYGMLSDEQKARFNGIGQENRERRGTVAPTAQACGPNTLIPEWPQARIEKSVQPSEGQRILLDKLRNASAKAADMLKAACPAEPPATPTARLSALASRLDTLLQAVQLVHAALNGFYGSLTDEQKAQFNGIPPAAQVAQPKG